MADVFISYAREDHESAKRLAEAIEARGWSVWWDPLIRAGHAFERVIERELAAARCVVALWTPHSVDSNWVRNEAFDASRRGILIPVRLHSDVSMPLSFRHLHAADVLAWTKAEVEECLAAIDSMIGAPAKATPAPPSKRPVATPSEEQSPWPRSRFFELAMWLTIAAIVLGVASGIYDAYHTMMSVNAPPAQAASSTLTVTGNPPLPKEITTTIVAANGTTSTSTMSVTTLVEVVHFETDAGRITIELFPELAPNHVSYFRRLVEEGRYRGRPVRPLMPFGFGVEGVDANDIDVEPTPIVLRKGIVLMADRGARALLIRTTDHPQASFPYTAFGRVINGMEIVEDAKQERSVTIQRTHIGPRDIPN